MIVSRHARKRLGWVPTWSLVENPQDPVEYLPESCDLGGEFGIPSMWAQSTWPATAEALELQLYRGDQGPFGHVKRKPTTWASNRPLPELCVKGPSSVSLVGVEVGASQPHGPRCD